MSAKHLTHKQIKFANEYLIDYNATQAAIRAGYSKKTAYSIASENLRKPEVQIYLSSKKEKIAEKLEISQQRTMTEIGRIAYQDVRQFYDDEGNLIPIHELCDDAAAVLAGMDIDEIFEWEDGVKKTVGVTKKIKRYDKTKALEMLAKHYKIFDHQPPTNININLSGLSAKDLETLLELKQKLSNESGI